MGSSLVVCGICDFCMIYVLNLILNLSLYRLQNFGCDLKFFYPIMSIYMHTYDSICMYIKICEIGRISQSVLQSPNSRPYDPSSILRRISTNYFGSQSKKHDSIINNNMTVELLFSQAYALMELYQYGITNFQKLPKFQKKTKSTVRAFLSKLTDLMLPVTNTLNVAGVRKRKLMFFLKKLNQPTEIGTEENQT